MGAEELASGWKTWRLLIIGVLVVIGVIGIVLVARAMLPTAAVSEEPGRANALANSNDECVVCHRRTTPGIVEQYGHSTMAAAEVRCVDCHEVPPTILAPSSTKAPTCSARRRRPCASVATAPKSLSTYQSRHSLPAYVAYAGTGSSDA